MPSADYNGFPRYSQYDWDEPECILPVCSCRVWDQLQHTHTHPHTCSSCSDLLRLAQTCYLDLFGYCRCSFFTVLIHFSICVRLLRQRDPMRASWEHDQFEGPQTVGSAVLASGCKCHAEPAFKPYNQSIEHGLFDFRS